MAAGLSRRAAGAVVLAGVLAGPAWGQIQAPPVCRDVTIDHEQFRVHGRHVKLRIRFHTPDGAFAAQWTLTTPRPPDAEGGSCTSGAATSFVATELLRKAGEFLPP